VCLRCCGMRVGFCGLWLPSVSKREGEICCGVQDHDSLRPNAGLDSDSCTTPRSLIDIHQTYMYLLLLRTVGILEGYLESTLAYLMPTD
jgi:hypothetical protein